MARDRPSPARRALLATLGGCLLLLALPVILALQAPQREARRAELAEELERARERAQALRLEGWQLARDLEDIAERTGWRSELTRLPGPPDPEDLARPRRRALRTLLDQAWRIELREMDPDGLRLEIAALEAGVANARDPATVARLRERLAAARARLAGLDR